MSHTLTIDLVVNGGEVLSVSISERVLKDLEELPESFFREENEVEQLKLISALIKYNLSLCEAKKKTYIEQECAGDILPGNLCCNCKKEIKERPRNYSSDGYGHISCPHCGYYNVFKEE